MICELCNQDFPPNALRPYGPNREMICEPCGQKDPETTLTRMSEALERAEAESGGVLFITAHGFSPVPTPDTIAILP